MAENDKYSYQLLCYESKSDIESKRPMEGILVLKGMGDHVPRKGEVVLLNRGTGSLEAPDPDHGVVPASSKYGTTFTVYSVKHGVLSSDGKVGEPSLPNVYALKGLHALVFDIE